MKYFMGIDTVSPNINNGKNDNAVCVMDEEGNIRYMWQTKNKEQFDQEVDRLKRYYGIPDWAVIKETN